MPFLDDISKIKSSLVTLTSTSPTLYDCTNHKEVKEYLNSTPDGKILYDKLYSNIRMHIKIFSSWLESNGMVADRFTVTSYKKEGREKSPSHGKLMAIDLSCGKIHQIYLFYLYMVRIFKANNKDYHIAISSHNKHIHIDMLPDRVGKFSVELYDESKNLYTFDDFSDSWNDRLKKFYDFGSLSERLYQYMWKDYKFSLPSIPSFGYLWIIPVIIVLFLIKKIFRG